MDLELATIMDIADELANRGSQFIIAIQIFNNNESPSVHLCTDGGKDQREVAETIMPLFNLGQTEIFDE